jgi:hypothetical protein
MQTRLAFPWRPLACLFVTTALGCSASTEGEVGADVAAHVTDRVVDPDRVTTRFYVHASIYGFRRFGFDVERAALTEHVSDPAALASAHAFVLVPRYDASLHLHWQRHDLHHMDTTIDVARYRGSAGADLVVDDHARHLGVAFGLDTGAGVIWMQRPGANTPVEEGGDGIPLDGTL